MYYLSWDSNSHLLATDARHQLREIVKNNVPYLTWDDFPKVLIPLTELFREVQRRTSGTFKFTISLNKKGGHSFEED